MTNASDLEEFTKFIKKSVGRQLEKLNFLEDYEGDPDFKDRLAYYERVKNNDITPKYFWYLPKLYLCFNPPNDFGGYDFVIEIYCTWHLLKNAKSLCSYLGLHDTDGFLKSNLALIQNHTITQAIFIPDKLNLFLEFDNHYWLAIFPNNLGFRVSGWCIHNNELGFQVVPH